MTRKPRGGNAVRRPRSRANLIATVAIVVLAIVVIGGVLVVNRTGDAEPGDQSVQQKLANAPERDTLTVSEDGKVTVVEFLDYQCPACAAYYRNVTKDLEADYAGRITFATRNFPLDTHPLARPAARAAEAAAEQGHYREMYHALYDNYQAWALSPDGDRISDDRERATRLFDRYATRIGLDLNRFHADLTSEDVGDRIEADLALGHDVGVRSTPTIFVNGERFEPTEDQFPEIDRQLRDLIDEELGE